MSGNPFIGNQNREPYREAYKELVEGSNVRRLNDLHKFDSDKTIN